MHDRVSPYALLCLSRPRSAPTAPTDYDLYSRVLQSGLQSDLYFNPVSDLQPAPRAEQARHTPAMRQSDPSDSGGPDASRAVRRTHYIADIHAKHSAAGRHAVANHEPLK